MIRNIAFTLIIAFGFATNLLAAGASKQHIEDFEFSFEGPLAVLINTNYKEDYKYIRRFVLLVMV